MHVQCDRRHPGCPCTRLYHASMGQVGEAAHLTECAPSVTRDRSSCMAVRAMELHFLASMVPS